MKTNYIKAFIFFTVLVLSMGSCKKLDPSTAIDEESALTNPADAETATIGTYALLRSATYIRSIHFLTEFQSDNVAQGQSSSDDLTRCYRYTHIPTGTHATQVWTQAYKVISAANRIIEFISDDAGADGKQIKGENLYLRAMMHFNLVMAFGRPYNQGLGANPGIPILKEGLTDDEKNTIGRRQVREVYEFVIADLLKAADFLTKSKNNNFASKEVAYALLSRVYLNMGDYANSIKYASLVIDSGKYSLLEGSAYASYFKGVPESNKETIFCVRYTTKEDQDFSAIGSMYYSGTVGDISTAGGQGNTGWAEIYASQKYWDLLDQHPADLRHSFIAPYKIDGILQTNKKLTPNAPMYYVTKYSLQEGLANLSSPVYLRLAEMYLNRAEANAKLGNSGPALTDVNTIRKRANIPEITNMPAGKTILDVVLQERQLELAFEGQRAYDLFRNNMPVVRNYPGTHSLGNSPTTNTSQVVQPTDTRVIFFIPQSQIDNNKNLTQNP